MNQEVKTLKDLWKKRWDAYVKMLGKYMRLIVNDHFSIIMMVILAFAAIYYQQLLTQLQAGLHTQGRIVLQVLCMGIMLIVFSFGEPLWLMHDSDKSYLFPQGRAWSAYWLHGSLISSFLPLLVIGLVSMLIYPFYILVSQWQSQQMVLFIALVLIGKMESILLIYLNIYQLGGTIKGRPLTSWEHSIIFTIMLILVGYLPAPYNLFVLVGIEMIVACYIIWAMNKRKTSLMRFEYAIEQDRKRQANFYRWVSLFTDVPQMKIQVKRRAYLDWIYPLFSSANNDLPLFIYVRRLVRNTAYSGIWLKVIGFFLVLLLASDQIYITVGLGIVAQLLTVMQLAPLLKQVCEDSRLKVYPYGHLTTRSKFKYVLLLVLMSQWIILSLAVIGQNDMFWIVLTWLAGVVFWVYFYLPYWMKRHL